MCCKFAHLVSVLFSTVAAIAAVREPFTTAAELNASLWTNSTSPILRPFTLRGTLTAQLFQREFVFEDSTGRILLHLDPGQDPRVGDIVDIAGHISDKPTFRTEAWSKTLTVVGHTNAPPFAERPLDSLRGLDSQALPVVTSGIAEEIFRDEVDPNWSIFILTDGRASLPVSVRDVSAGGDLAERFLGRRIRLSGICLYNLKGDRRYSGLRILVRSPADIRLEPDVSDRDRAVPPVDFSSKDPTTIVAQGRRSVEGAVIAAWRGNRVLVRTESGDLVRIHLVRGEPLPRVGDCIRAVGNVETDLLNINLSKARLSAGTFHRKAPQSAPPLSPDDLFNLSANGIRSLNGQAYGRLIHARGLVVSLPQPGVADTLINIRCGDVLLPVDVGNCPDIASGIPVGSSIELTGVCAFETENWHSGNPFPRITGFAIVLNDAKDLRVLSRPSWWTARRLFAALGVLLAALAAVGVWDILLRRTVARRERELETEIVSRIGSDFKIRERTRLAVELHDAISQNLTGIALELSTASRLENDPLSMNGHLARAKRTLAACREELKNCIWDLRNAALDESDLNEAVRRTLEPHLGGTTLVTHIAIPREKLTENTAHTLLRILREIATNAVRHGHARTLRVAGCVDRGKLLMSVRDDGTGFDPATAPGVEDGHFGLEGIRQRIDAFGGELSIESSIGAGTRVTIALTIPSEEIT